MTIYLKQSTASQEILLGPFLSSTDGTTAKTGLTIANTNIKIWKTGGTTVGDKASGGATEISAGYYYATLDATDTDTLGSLIITVNVATALMIRLECAVLSANVYDNWFSTGNVSANVIAISGDATAADNCESFFDGTGYAGTNNVIPTVTTCTTATNLTNAPTNGDLTATMKSSVTAAVPTAATISDAVWDEASTGHTDAGKAGAQMWTDVDAILEDTGTTIPGTLSSIDGAVDDVYGVAGSIVADTNELQTDWKNGGRLDLILDGASAPSAATVADAVWDEALSGHTGSGSAGLALSTASSGGVDPSVLADAIWDEVISTGHSTSNSAGKILYDNLNAPVGTVDTVVDGIATQVGTAGAGLTALPWNAAWDAEVQSECTDALNAYDPPTNAEMEARTIAAASYATATALDTVDNFLDTEVAAILAAVDTEVAAIKTVTDAIGATGTGLSAIPWNAAWDAEVQSECTDALNAYDPPTKAELDTGLDALPTAAEVKTAIEAAGGSLALILEDTGTTLDGKLNTIDDFLDTEVAAILADTNELQTDLVNGGRLDLLIDSILEDTGTTLPATLATLTTRSYPNYKITSPVFSVTGKMTSCTVTRYPTKADADAGTNGIAYAVTATYDGDDNLATYNEVATS